MDKTIQGRVADEVMQRPDTITLGGREYEVAPPSVGTLILVSEEVAELPEMRLDTGTLVYDAIREAKNCRGIGRAVATLILGAKRIKQARSGESDGGKGCMLKALQRLKSGRKTDIVGELAETVLDTATPHELQEALTELVKRMQLGDFFGVTTFLTGINTTRPTRKVAKRTTARGRS